MEFRAQESDNQMMRSTTSAAGSLSYTHLPKDQSPGSGAATTDNRKSLNANMSSATSHNGNSTTGLTSNCTTQTLENICPRPFQTRPAQLHVQQQPLKDLEHNSPDPSPFSPLPAVMKSKTTSSAAVKYRECLKNHAASVGGSVFDGCGEFMPSGQEGSLEALKCAACQCHRNFHRKEVDGESNQLYSPGSRRSSTATTTRALMLNPLQLTPPLPSPSLHHHHPNQHNHHGHHHHHPHHHKYPIVQPMNVAYGGATAGTESSSEDLNVYGQSTAEGGVPPPPFALSKKRFRTKFTQEQKDRMLEFAEKVGWRIQKQDEEEVERFCSEVGVKRQVLKVWMHNNKSAVKKQQENMMMMTANNNSTSGDIHDNMQSLEVSEAAEDEALDT